MENQNVSLRIPEVDVLLWRDARGWHFDGPVSCGPPHVRNSGRGPYWRGDVTPEFAALLQRKAREKGMEVKQS